MSRSINLITYYNSDGNTVERTVFAYQNNINPRVAKQIRIAKQEDNKANRHAAKVFCMNALYESN